MLRKGSVRSSRGLITNTRRKKDGDRRLLDVLRVAMVEYSEAFDQAVRIGLLVIAIFLLFVPIYQILTPPRA
jgi:hypothetical protein